MQVAILAGGKGTRLKPLTDHTPKPMVQVHGKPFLQHQLEFIRSFGFTNVLLLVGYMAAQFEEYFENGSRFGLSLQYSCETTPLGTGGALRNAADKLAEEFLLLNGDTFLPIHYGELTDHFHRNDAKAVITVYTNPEGTFQNNIAIEEPGFVTDYNKKSSTGMTHIDAGAIVLKKEILQFIPQGQPCSLEEDILHQIIQARELKAYITTQIFYDMGTLEGLKSVQGALQ